MSLAQSRRVLLNPCSVRFGNPIRFGTNRMVASDISPPLLLDSERQGLYLTALVARFLHRLGLQLDGGLSTRIRCLGQRHIFRVPNTIEMGLRLRLYMNSPDLVPNLKIWR